MMSGSISNFPHCRRVEVSEESIHGPNTTAIPWPRTNTGSPYWEPVNPYWVPNELWEHAHWTPPKAHDARIFTTDEKHVVQFSLAGLSKDDVSVTMDGGTLIVSLEKAFELGDGAVMMDSGWANPPSKMTVLLPDHVDAGSAKAKMENGLLTVEFDLRLHRGQFEVEIE